MSTSFLQNISTAIADIWQGMLHWRIWGLLAYQDIRGRYRRSKIGPFWITLSMGVTVLMLGFLYSKLFNMPTTEYIPYLAAGMITWNFISIACLESSNVFMESSHLFKQIKLPYSLVIFRLCMRNLIILLHNLIIMLPIVYIFNIPLSWNMLLVFPGLVVCSLFVFIYAYIFAIISARYRDMAPIISNLIQITFFVTPIIWKASILPLEYQYLNLFNPILPLIDLIRAPLLGQPISNYTILAAGMTCGIGLLLLITLLQNSYRKIIYWL